MEVVGAGWGCLLRAGVRMEMPGVRGLAGEKRSERSCGGGDGRGGLGGVVPGVEFGRCFRCCCWGAVGWWLLLLALSTLRVGCGLDAVVLVEDAVHERVVGCAGFLGGGDVGGGVGLEGGGLEGGGGGGVGAGRAGSVLGLWDFCLCTCEEMGERKAAALPLGLSWRS